MLRAAALIVDRDAGVHLADDLGAGRFDGQVRGQGKNLLARGHDLADGHLVQFQGAVDERLLKAGQDAHAAGGGGDQLQLLGRVDLSALGHGNVKAAKDGRGRTLQQAHRRPGQRHEDEHGRGHGDGQRLGAAQGQRFGHQFAYHDLHVGDEGQAQRDGGDVSVNPGVGLDER